MTEPAPARSRAALWLTVALYAGAAAAAGAAILLVAALAAPGTLDAGPSAQALSGALHALLGAAAGSFAVGRLRRDGSATGGSRAIAAACVGITLGLGAWAGGTLVDVMTWSRRVESALPAWLVVLAAAAGAWLAVTTAGFGPAAAPTPPAAPPPPALTEDQRRLARAALETLDRSQVQLERLRVRPASPALTRAEAHAVFAPMDDYSALCSRLAGSRILGPLLDAGQATIDALRLTIVDRGWSAAIDIAAADAWVGTVAARYGLGTADATAAAEAVRQEAARLRDQAAAAVAASLRS